MRPWPARGLEHGLQQPGGGGLAVRPRHPHHGERPARVAVDGGGDGAHGRPHVGHRTSGTPRPRGRAQRRATAPRATASGAKSWPSARSPGTQQKSAPGTTARESWVTAVTRRGVALDGEDVQLGRRPLEPHRGAGVAGRTGLSLSSARHDPDRRGGRGRSRRRGHPQQVEGGGGDAKEQGAAISPPWYRPGLVDDHEDRELGILGGQEAGERRHVGTGLVRAGVVDVGLAGGAGLPRHPVAVDPGRRSGADLVLGHADEHLRHLLGRVRGHHPAHLGPRRRGARRRRRPWPDDRRRHVLAAVGDRVEGAEHLHGVDGVLLADGDGADRGGRPVVHVRA